MIYVYTDYASLNICVGDVFFLSDGFSDVFFPPPGECLDDGKTYATR